MVQEVSSAKKVTIHCGQQSMEWNEFVRLQNFLGRKHCASILEWVAARHTKLNFIVDAVQNHGPRALILEGTSAANPPSLSEMMLKHQHKRCSEPKDKVYGIVGLTAAKDDPKLSVNYTKTIRRVYTDATKHIISRAEKLDIVCAKPRSSTSSHGLPSWVPDWDADSRVTALPMKFCASQQTHAKDAIRPLGYALTAKGYLVDVVQVHKPAVRMSSPQDTKGAMETFCVWHRLVRCFAPFIKDEALLGGTSIVLKQSWRESAFSRVVSCSTNPVTQQRERDEFVISALVMEAARVCPELIEDELPYLSYREVTEMELPTAVALVKTVAKIMLGRSFFMSGHDNLLGMGPGNLTKGDIICILHGCQFPVVLRTAGDHYTLIGPAYIDGLMWGEAMEDEEKELTSWKIY